MSHLINFEGIHEKLFILRHMVHGASSYCETEEIASGEDVGDQSFDEYWSQLKALLSNYLIECAVKARMIQEFCAKDDDEGNLTNYEKEAVGLLSLGKVHQGQFNLSLREASNKIIHATRAVIEFQDSRNSERDCKVWDGKYHLFGIHGKNDWHVELCVENWAKSMVLYLELLASNKKTIYMGQDWS